MLPIDRATLEVAAGMPGQDFEDNLQLASALAAGISYIVTRNPRDFTDPRCPPISAADLLALINARP